MNTTPQATGKLDAIHLLKIMKKWRKQLLYVFVGSALLGFIISLPIFMKPLFKSVAVVYPANLQPYSKETPTEQMVQLLNSEDVRDSIINKFHLYKHYKVDSTGAYPRYEIAKQMEDNISISKNEFEAIQITVMDQDPQMAKDICEGIIHFTDQKAKSLVHQRADEVVSILLKQMNREKAVLDSMDAQITIIRQEYGITDFENQVEGFSREYYRSLSSGGSSSKMETAKKNLEEKGAEYMTLKENLWRVRGTYNDIRERYVAAYNDSQKELNFHNVISPPLKPERKDWPKRSLIMALFSLSCLFIAVVVIVYQERYQTKIFDALNTES
jgi:LPS O-antigen subunit length determinant protein (WzzB/FepE family)